MYADIAFFNLNVIKILNDYEKHDAKKLTERIPMLCRLNDK